MFIATRARRFIKNNLPFTFLLSATVIFVFVGGYFLFLQAERVAAPQRGLSTNWKAWFILGCYGTLVKLLSYNVRRNSFADQGLVSLVLTGRRARILALKLRRIPQKEHNAPPAVRQFIQDEYWRTCAIAYASHPKGSKQEGWGTPGSAYDGIYFRLEILDTISVLDTQARIIVPRLPALRPHVCMMQHFRALAALFPSDGLSCLESYDSVVQLARYSLREPTEVEFELGMRAFQQLLEIFAEYLDDQSTY